jgi:uncharacterized membrane protein
MLNMGTSKSKENVQNEPPMQRLRAIDSARGSAMLFVFLAHFIEVYRPGVESQFLLVLHTIAMLATPSFMIISGMMLGFLFNQKGKDFGKFQFVLLDRGIFYLLVGHPVISLAYGHFLGSFSKAFMSVYITDVIGVCSILGPNLICRLDARVRIKAGILGYFLSWVTVFFWLPSNWSLIAIKEIFVGDVSGVSTLWYTFPVVPWLCIYLCCTAAGERLFTLVKGRDKLLVEKFFRRLALTALGFALFFVFGCKFWRLLGGVSHDFPGRWLTIYQKSPPGPIYILFFGGVGVSILYFLFRHLDAPFFHPYISLTEMLGRVSFFAFILQYFVFQFTLFSILPHHTKFWPTYLFVSIAFILAVTKVWYINGYNRFISFTYFINLLRERTLLLKVTGGSLKP